MGRRTMDLLRGMSRALDLLGDPYVPVVQIRPSRIGGFAEDARKLRQDTAKVMKDFTRAARAETRGSGA